MGAFLPPLSDMLEAGKEEFFYEDNKRKMSDWKNARRPDHQANRDYPKVCVTLLQTDACSGVITIYVTD